MGEHFEDKSIRRTHDLIMLLDLLSANRISAPPHVEWLDELNPYAVEARYGNINPEGLNRERALSAAAEVLTWASAQVAQVPST